MSDRLDDSRHYLEYCRLSMEELKSANSEIRAKKAFEDFSLHYASCVGAIKRCTEKGKNTKWAQNLIAEQRDDDVLNYLFQFRNALHRTRRRSSGQPTNIADFMTIDIPEGGQATNIHIDVTDMSTGKRTVVGFDWKDGNPDIKYGSAEIKKGVAYVLPNDVENRGHTYKVPDLGVQKQLVAVELCKFALSWLKNKFAELEEL